MAIDIEYIMNNPDKLDSLSPVELDEALQGIEEYESKQAAQPKVENDSITEDTDTETPPKEDLVEPEKKEIPKKELPKKDASKDKLSELKRERFELADKLNQERQRAEKLEKQLAEQKIESKSKVSSDPDKLWADENQQAIILELQELRKQQAELLAEREALRQKQQIEDTYREAQELADYAGLSVNISEADKAFQLIHQKQGKEPTLEELSEEIGALEAEAYFDILSTFRTKAKEGYKKAKTAWIELDMADKWASKKPKSTNKSEEVDEGETPLWMRAQQEEVKKDIAKAKSRTPTMPSSYSATGKLLTQEFVNRWLETHPDPSKWTTDDKKTFDSIQAKFL